MEACFPQQEGRCPCNICVELVVQGSCAQHANRSRSQDGRHNEIWRDPLGHDVLIPRFRGRNDKLEELAGRAFGRLDPARVREEQKQTSMHGQEAEREGLGEESLLGNEAPVDGPFVEEGTRELKRAAEVAEALLPEWIAKQNLFYSVNTSTAFKICFNPPRPERQSSSA